MNILLLCIKPPWPARDGGTLATLNMVKAFHRAGHLVTVLTMNTPKHYVYLRDLPEAIQSLGTFYAVDVDTGIRLSDVLANFIFSKASYHVQRFTSGPFRAQLESLLRERSYDVVQLEGLYLGPYIDTIRAMNPYAVVALRAHNIEHEIWARRATNEGNPLRKYVYMETADRIRSYEEGLIKQSPFDVLVPITGRDAGFFKKMGMNKPLHVCPSGFDIEDLIPDLEEEEDEVPMAFPSVGYLGAMDWEPNREGVAWFLQEVWPRVAAAFPEVKFTLAGRNMPDKFFRYASSQVVVVGEVPDAARFIRSQAILVVPVLSGSGMRIKIIEAMAHGRAVVATHMAAEGIGVTDTDHIFLADDPAEFAGRIKVLIEQRALYDTIAQRAEEFIRNRFNNDRLVSNLLDFYQRNLRKPEPPEEPAE
jgi:glycosyltransferase involved in cell wall biosynthesis